MTHEISPSSLLSYKAVFFLGLLLMTLDKQHNKNKPVALYDRLKWPENILGTNTFQLPVLTQYHKFLRQCIHKDMIYYNHSLPSNHSVARMHGSTIASGPAPHPRLLFL